MKKKLILIVACVLLSTSSYAFKCFITAAKDSCWLDFNVTIYVIDLDSGKNLATISIPKGKAWTRVETQCNPSQELKMQADFNPVFWQSDEGKNYKAKQYWQLPTTIKPGEAAWNLNICYPANFAQVPLPPSAGSNCTCDFTKIPSVPLQKQE